MFGKRTSTIFTVVVYVLVAGMLAIGYFSTREKPAEEPAPAPKTEVVVQGAIKPIGVNMKNVATHILIKDDGSVVILDGANMNLDKYIGEKRVEVRGIMETGQGGKEVLRVSNVDIAPDLMIQPEEKKPVSGWEIYQSSDLGISVKYKTDWTIITAQKILTFKIPQAGEVGAESLSSEPKFDSIIFEILPNAKKQTLDEYVAGLNDLMIQKSKIGLDGTAAYKRTLGAKVSYYAERESKYIYKISYVPAVSKTFDPNRNMFYEMVATMRFVPFGTS